MKALFSGAFSMVRARWYLRRAVRIGARVRLWGTPFVHVQGRLIVGDRVRVVSTVGKVEINVGPGATLEIGSGTYINYGCSIGATQSIRIGPQCHIGTHVIIIDNDFHRLEPDRRTERPPSKNVEIGANVWLGARVIVLPGVTIGNDSVVGAGSVVTVDIPTGVLAAGVPARVIRSLSGDEKSTQQSLAAK